MSIHRYVIIIMSHDCFVSFQLGITATTPSEFLSKAKDIVLKHKELDLHATALKNTVEKLDKENHCMVSVLCTVSCTVSCIVFCILYCVFCTV